jgi:hypothetical protein
LTPLNLRITLSAIPPGTVGGDIVEVT